MRLPPPYDRFWATVYLPSFLQAISQQAIAVLVPLYVLELGGSPAFAALVVGMRGIGVLLFDVPAGMLVNRFGDKPVLLGGLAAVLLSLLTMAVAPNLWIVALTSLPLGAGSAAWILGRQSYITDSSTPKELGRAIAAMAGLQRVGGFVGPAAGGMIAAAWGYPAAFVAGAGCAVLAAILVLLYTEHLPPKGTADGFGFAGTAQIVVEHARVFATAGIAGFSMQLMRASRQLLIPLMGEFVGLDAAAIGFIYSLSAAVDMSLFYPVGVVVDRWGRKWIAVPAMVLFTLGFAVLPFVQGYYSLLAASMLLGLANGVSTGIIMIMGSDLAPDQQQGTFLGVWRLIGDLGMSGGPLALGVLVDVASLAAASGAVAIAGAIGVVLVSFFVPETLPRSLDVPTTPGGTPAPH